MNASFRELIVIWIDSGNIARWTENGLLEEKFSSNGLLL